MPTRRHDHHRQLADPHQLGDAFASGFDLQDFDDWLRLVCWTDLAEHSRGGRRKAASIVMPRSALPVLMEILRGSAGGGHREARRH